MAKNVYFSGGTLSEQRLYEDLIIESLKIYGHDVYYLPREIVREDNLFKEDILSKFDENYLIEMYISNYEGFEGDGTLLTKFGVRISDEATFIISKRRWEDLISSSNNLVSSKRPNEGDVIYLPLTKQFFQIKFVEHEKPFRQLDSIQTYGLIAELMEFTNERFETGIAEIDKLPRDKGYSLVLKLSDGISDIVVTSGGSGYGSNTRIDFGPPGDFAEATPTISSGVITGIKITDPGINYSSAPAVLIVGSGSNASAFSIIGNHIPFEYKEIITGTANTAKAYTQVSGGSISNLVVFDRGSGYQTPPTITISEPNQQGGTRATATCTILGGKVTNITITNPGSGYTTSPKVTFSTSPLEATAEVIRFDGTTKELELINIIGEFTSHDTVRGTNSGAEWTINTFSSIENENDPEAENKYFEDQGDLILNFDEKNPFGEYGNMGVF